MAELSREDLHELYRRFDDEVYNKGNIDAIDELVTDGFRHHHPFPTPQGREGLQQFITGFRRPSPMPLPQQRSWSPRVVGWRCATRCGARRSSPHLTTGRRLTDVSRGRLPPP
jgi:hypothetical protein